MRPTRHLRLLRPAASALLLLVLSGCMATMEVAAPMPAPMPPPPPPPRLLTEKQAVDISADFARARGLVIDRTVAARLDGTARWHIHLVGPVMSAKVLVDGYSGRVLGQKFEPRQAPPPQPAQPPQAAQGQPQGPPPGHDDDWGE